MIQTCYRFASRLFVAAMTLASALAWLATAPVAEAAAAISLSPSSGAVGSAVTVTTTSTGFLNNKVPTLVFDGVTTSWSGSCKTTSTGGLPSGGCLFAVPIDGHGSHVIQVQTGNKTAQTNFTVISAIGISSGFGKQNDHITVTGTGFAKSATISMTWDGSSTIAPLSGSCTTGSGGVAVSNGSFPTSGSCSFTVPGASSGSHTLVFSDGANTATTPFLVTSATLQATSSGAPGSTVSVTGSGFTAALTLSLTWSPPSGSSSTLTFVNSGTGTACTTNNLNSGGSCTFSVPTGTVPAASGYTITVDDGQAGDRGTANFTVVTGASSQLNIRQDPLDNASAVDSSGNPLIVAMSPFSVLVQVQDAGGNLVINSVDQVQLAVSTQGSQSGASSGGTLMGGGGISPSGGIVTFGSLTIDKWGTSYVLQATRVGGGLTAATTDPFEVTIGAASKLAITQQWAAGATENQNQALGPFPIVAVEDAGGNVLDGSDGVSSPSSIGVIAELGINPGGGTLSGTLTQTAVNGLATFSDLSIDKSASGYMLSFGGSGVSSAVSNTFTVANVAPSVVIFCAVPTSSPCTSGWDPGSPTGGSVFPNQPVLEFQDGNGHSVPVGSGSVTLSISPPTSCTASSPTAVLSGQATVSTNGGADAAFAGLSLNAACTYVLHATGSTSTQTISASSSPFTVGVGPVVGLQFLTTSQAPAAFPRSVAAYQQFPVTVGVTDAGGNPEPGVTSGTVTLSVPSTDNLEGGALQGTTTATLSGGIAQFGAAAGGGVAITNPGGGYHLQAAASGYASGTSPAFDVTIATQPAKPLTIKKIAPNFGPPAGGNVVSISGTGFTGLTSVKFGPFPDGSYVAAANLVPASDTALQLTVPTPACIAAGTCAAGPGAVHLILNGSSGADNSQAINTLYSYGPYVAKLNPNVVSAAGGAVTILGGNLLQAKIDPAQNAGNSSLGVFFGSGCPASLDKPDGTPNATWSPSGKSLKIIVPACSPGPVKVTVVSTDGVSDASYDTTNFSFEAPAVKKVAKNYGPAGGSTTTTLYPVKVLGKNFGTSTNVSNLEVRFGHSCVAMAGSTIADPSCTTPTNGALSLSGTGGSSITVPLPPEDPADEATGIVDVQVCNLSGAQCSPVNGGDRFAYAPVIKKVVASSGKFVPTSGKFTLTVTGANLAGAYEIDFGGGSGAGGAGMVCVADLSVAPGGSTGCAFAVTQPFINSGTKLTVQVPLGVPFHAPGTVNLTVKSANGVMPAGMSVYTAKSVLTFVQT